MIFLKVMKVYLSFFSHFGEYVLSCSGEMMGASVVLMNRENGVLAVSSFMCFKVQLPDFLNDLAVVGRR